MSDDDEPVDDAAVILSFGKFRGKLVSDLAGVRTSRRYLQYLLTLSDLRDDTSRAIESALGRIPEPPLTYQEARDVRLPFGDHKGLTIGMVAKTKQGRASLSRLAKWDKLKEDLCEAIQLVIGKYEQLKASS